MKDDTLHYLSSILGALLGWMFGQLDGFMYALIVFVATDYITGVMAAAVEKRLSSEVGFKGICRKITIFLLVALANIIDVNIIKSGSVARTAVVFFYISNEGLSIVENAAILGLEIPDWFRQMLKRINEEEEPNVEIPPHELPDIEPPKDDEPKDEPKEDEKKEENENGDKEKSDKPKL